MAKFLSDEWFAKVKELTDDAGDIEIPGPLKDLTFNLTVSLPADVAKKIFIDMDQQAGMQAFMSGQMRVEGDVTKLMVLQTVQPTDDLKDLMADIIDITD